ncbi:MAG: SDR family NAD(P)-dependent oxidoreductase [Rhizobiaceae bacterium]
MSEPLSRPPKKNPQLRQKVATLPPLARSRAAMGLTAAAARGSFSLQHCSECATVQYPPRDACSACLCVDLEWRETDRGGSVVAQTTIHASPDPYYRQRLPWRSGLVKLDAGPSIFCHLHGDVRRGDRISMDIKLDRAGQGVMIALPAGRMPNMEDDPQLRTLTANPRHRRVLVTDIRAPWAVPLVHELIKAGASHVFVGEAEGWRRATPHESLASLEQVSILQLDVTDANSVKKLAAGIGGKTDILINTARHVRPGGVVGGDTVFARDEMEVNAFGLMRLAQAFGPAMASRTDDGINSAAAFVNILSASAMSAEPGYGAFSASQAAAYSISQTLRGEFRASGLRVMNVFVGPTDDEWHQQMPPPKVAPQALAKAVVDGLVCGLEDVYCGDFAKDIEERWRRDAKVLERELTGGEHG